MKRLLPLLFLLGLGALAPNRSDAADAYVIGAVSLRAGPDIGYPRIMTLPAGIPVSVYGCTDGWEWCDVQAQDNRGWVSGQFLQYEYQNQRVLLPDYGARVGIPIVAFALGVYWDQHYRNRSWYRQRDQWSHRRFAHRPPPRPQMRPPTHVTQRPTPPAVRPPTGHARPHGGSAQPAGNRPRPTGNAAHPQTPATRPAAQRPAPPAKRPPSGNNGHPAMPARNAAQRPASAAQRPAVKAKPATPARNAAQRPASAAQRPAVQAKPAAAKKTAPAKKAEPKKDRDKDKNDGGHP